MGLNGNGFGGVGTAVQAAPFGFLTATAKGVGSPLHLSAPAVGALPGRHIYFHTAFHAFAAFPAL
jgi:hypothetical protein